MLQIPQPSLGEQHAHTQLRTVGLFCKQALAELPIHAM